MITVEPLHRRCKLGRVMVEKSGDYLLQIKDDQPPASKSPSLGRPPIGRPVHRPVRATNPQTTRSPLQPMPPSNALERVKSKDRGVKVGLGRPVRGGGSGPAFCASHPR
jgi:hypothetical protein